MEISLGEWLYLGFVIMISVFYMLHPSGRTCAKYEQDKIRNYMKNEEVNNDSTTHF